jgi:hypothetical protein
MSAAGRYALTLDGFKKMAADHGPTFAVAMVCSSFHARGMTDDEIRAEVMRLVNECLEGGAT